MIGWQAYPVAPALPLFTENTPTYNDEGTTTTGWTNVNGTISQPSGSVVRLTQVTTGTVTSLQRAVTMPVSGGDFTLYAKVRARANTGDVNLIQFIGAGNLRLNLYFNFNVVAAPSSAGTISLRYQNSGGTTYDVVCATGLDIVNTWQEVLLHYDQAMLTSSVYLRQSDGSWKFGGQVPGSAFSADLKLIINNSAASAGVWMEFDYLTLTAANIVAIWDSICGGSTLFSPNQSSGLTNGDSCWMRWAPVYTSLRNNFIVNKGVASNTSAMVAARIQADALNQLPKAVFLGACNNDYGAGISQATRTANIQTSLNLINAASAKPILVNALYNAAALAGQPLQRDYYRTWWREYRGTLTGLRHQIDPMNALRDASGYLDAAYVQADNVHPNVAGYTRMGKYIAGKKYA